MNRRLKVAVASDIHLGHRRNPTQRIIDNLNKYLTNTASLRGVDILFLAGDVFDESMSIHSDPVGHIMRWIHRCLQICERENVKIRVLEGTPSHDRKQSHLFEVVSEMMFKSSGKRADLKFVTGLEIEHFPDWDMNVLYIPDELNHSTERTLEEVKALMASKELTQVDFAIMHGQFEFQLPPHVKNIPRHDSAEYLKLVKHLTFIGHVHLHNRYKRIFAQGSFDRLAHGEEGPKGYLKATIEPDGSYEMDFIENVDAMKFVSMDCFSDDVEYCLTMIRDKAATLPQGSHLRVFADKSNPIVVNPDVLKELCLHVELKIEPKSEDGEYSAQSFTQLLDVQEYEPLILNAQSLSVLLPQRLARLNLPGQVLQSAHEHLKEALSIF